MSSLLSLFRVVKGSRPDITAAQIVAAAFAAAYPVCVFFGVDMSPEQREALEEIKWVALGLFGADAALRVGRNMGDAKKEQASAIVMAEQAAARSADHPQPEELAPPREIEEKDLEEEFGTTEPLSGAEADEEMGADDEPQVGNGPVGEGR